MADIIVTYKGRQYRQKFRGQTKFGLKCKLEFLDGSKEFWADASSHSRDWWLNVIAAKGGA